MRRRRGCGWCAGHLKRQMGKDGNKLLYWPIFSKYFTSLMNTISAVNQQFSRACSFADIYMQGPIVAKQVRACHAHASTLATFTVTGRAPAIQPPTILIRALLYIQSLIVAKQARTCPARVYTVTGLPTDPPAILTRACIHAHSPPCPRNLAGYAGYGGDRWPGRLDGTPDGSRFKLS